MGHGNYTCIGPDGKVEWPNFNEDDGTKDGSQLTSIATDNLLYTSPSPDPVALAAPNIEEISVSVTSRLQAAPSYSTSDDDDEEIIE